MPAPVRSHNDEQRFCALADALRTHNRTADGRTEFTPDHLLALADFCASQDSNFNRRQWMDYIAGQGGLGDELIDVESESLVIPGGIEGHASCNHNHSVLADV